MGFRVRIRLVHLFQIFISWPLFLEKFLVWRWWSGSPLQIGVTGYDLSTRGGGVFEVWGRWFSEWWLLVRSNGFCRCSCTCRWKSTFASLWQSDCGSFRATYTENKMRSLSVELTYSTSKSFSKIVYWITSGLLVYPNLLFWNYVKSFQIKVTEL